jgi:hypothetical protein
MTFLTLLPVVLSILVLAAHFLRGFYPAAFVLLALLPLLAIRERWVRRAAQAILGAGTLVWLWTAFTIASQRMALGAPFGRMLVILGSVAAFTALSALLLETPRMRRRYASAARADVPAAEIPAAEIPAAGAESSPAAR